MFWHRDERFRTGTSELPAWRRLTLDAQSAGSTPEDRSSSCWSLCREHCMRLVTILLILLTAGKAYSEDSHHDFRQGSANQPLLVPTGPSAAQAIRADPAGLRITLASK